MGWSWAAACGVQGRGHIARLSAQLISHLLLATLLNLAKVRIM